MGSMQQSITHICLNFQTLAALIDRHSDQHTVYWLGSRNVCSRWAETSGPTPAMTGDTRAISYHFIPTNSKTILLRGRLLERRTLSIISVEVPNNHYCSTGIRRDFFFAFDNPRSRSNRLGLCLNLSLVPLGNEPCLSSPSL